MSALQQLQKVTPITMLILPGNARNTSEREESDAKRQKTEHAAGEDVQESEPNTDDAEDENPVAEPVVTKEDLASAVVDRNEGFAPLSTGAGLPPVSVD